jgi:hypothetical protein
VFETGDGHHARSYGQQFVTHFDGRGATVVPDEGEWTFGLELAGYGRDGATTWVDAPRAIVADGRRLAYEWDGTLTEWYVNREAGLEHGFTVHTRPAGSGDLVVDLRLRGALAPIVDADGRGVSLWATSERAALTYSGLEVVDAQGEPLAARIVWASGTLQIRVVDDEATYPIEIDPLVQQVYLKPPVPNSDDRFGTSIALSGDTVVIGAPGEDSNATGIDGNQGSNTASDSGAAYVFVRTGGAWSQQAYVKASNTGSGDSFGSSVALFGDTLVVGAPNEGSNATGVNGNQADNSLNGSGAAYVFVRSAGVWSQQAYLKASNTGAADSFGSAVDISGDTLVVGADGEDSNATGVGGDQANNLALQSGAVYVFVRSAGVWSQQAYVKASNTQELDDFGRSVAVDGDTLVVGAPFESSSATGVGGDQANDSSTFAGAAYVFVRSAGVWSQQAYLKASNTGSFDQFGGAVDVSADTVVVGADGEQSDAVGVNGDQSNDLAGSSGAVYVFVRSAGVWSQQAYLKASNTGAGDEFGLAVALDADTLVVAAIGEGSSATGVDGDQGNDAAAFSGAAYVFVRSAGVWSQQAYLKASNTGVSDAFGFSVALDADTVVVGAIGEGSNGAGIGGFPADNSAPNSGAAYAFVRASGGWSPDAYLKAVPGSDSGDAFGFSVAVAGTTVVVGAPLEDSGATGVGGDPTNNASDGSGAAYVFVRTAGAWSQQAYLKASNTGANDEFGRSVAVSGDTLVVGAPLEDSIATGVGGIQTNNAAGASGAAYVFVRTAGVWSQQAYLKASNTGANDEFGRSVAIAGDTIAVGAPREGSAALGVGGDQSSNASAEAGATYVFTRTAGTWSQQAYVKASNTQAGDEFGWSVAVDGETLVVGARFEDSNATVVNGSQVSESASAAGAAYVFLRSGGVWTQQAYLKASNAEAGDQFGTGVDVSGNRIVVGAPLEDSSATGVGGDQSSNLGFDSGAAYVFARSGGAWTQQAYLKASNVDVAASADQFGFAVAIDGDELLVGAFSEDGSATGVDGDQGSDGAPDAGAAYLFVRSAAGWQQRHYLKASNAGTGDDFGRAVALSERLLVVGAPRDDAGVLNGVATTPSTNSGAVYAFQVDYWEQHEGCLGNPATWTVPSVPARLGVTSLVGLDGAGITNGIAATYFGALGLDLGGCGVPFGSGEFLLSFVPFPTLLGFVPMVGGLATVSVAVPASASLVGVRVTLQAAVIDTLTFADELSTALEFEIRP